MNLLLPILLLIAVGLMWTVLGAIMSGVSHRQLSMPLVQIGTYGLGLLFGLVGCAVGFFPPLSLSRQVLIGGSLFFSAGILTFFLNELTVKAMAKGPNALVWAILQSGMLIPFVLGVVVHGNPVGPIRIVGMGLLVGALILMSMGRQQNEEKRSYEKTWIWLAFASFLVCGIQQSLSNETSYHAAIRDAFHVIHRSVYGLSGLLLAAVLSLLCKRTSSLTQDIVQHIRSKTFWCYVVVFQVVSMAANVFIAYRAMDWMAELDAGAISYPVMVVSCIAGFAVYAAIALHERITWQAWIGLVMCMGGMVCVSMG